MYSEDGTDCPEQYMPLYAILGWAWKGTRPTAKLFDQRHMNLSQLASSFSDALDNPPPVTEEEEYEEWEPPLGMTKAGLELQRRLFASGGGPWKRVDLVSPRPALERWDSHVAQ